ncbi:MAG TPA: hypothetical protein VGK89_12300 [Candidatus Eisenbacteria bacterium]|jgi:hypothetical protein
MKRHPLILASLALLGLTALAPVAGAQDPVDRVQTALDQTDRRIEQAQSLLASSDNERARFELNLAINIQAQAKSVFGAGTNPAVFPQVVRLTLEARAHADRAIAIVKGLPDPDRVQIQLERTREVIDRARQRIEECDINAARALLQVGIEMQVRAEAAFAEGRFLAALQLTMSARERVLKALRMCNAEENLGDSAERVLKRTDEVLARVQDVVAERGDERARDALARAQQLEDRATEEFRAQRFEASIRLSLAARAAAYRAIRLAGGGL